MSLQNASVLNVSAVFYQTFQNYRNNGTFKAKFHFRAFWIRIRKKISVHDSVFFQENRIQIHKSFISTFEIHFLSPAYANFLLFPFSQLQENILGIYYLKRCIFKAFFLVLYETFLLFHTTDWSL